MIKTNITMTSDGEDIAFEARRQKDQSPSPSTFFQNEMAVRFDDGCFSCDHDYTFLSTFYTVELAAKPTGSSS
jgi:hypothetical protein